MFILVHIHKYSLTDIEQMIPFERDIFLDLIQIELQRQREQMENL